jgi:hypothetical protein
MHGFRLENHRDGEEYDDVYVGERVLLKRTIDGVRYYGWMDLPQDRLQWMALVKTVMNRKGCVRCWD